MRDVSKLSATFCPLSAWVGVPELEDELDRECSGEVSGLPDIAGGSCVALFAVALCFAVLDRFGISEPGYGVSGPRLLAFGALSESGLDAQFRLKGALRSVSDGFQ